jgi:hypothetical protein
VCAATGTPTRRCRRREPAGRNSPGGAIIDYWLGTSVSGAVTFEILDNRGAVVRRYSSGGVAQPPDSELNIPTYWIQSTDIPAANARLRHASLPELGAIPDSARH